MTDEMDFRLMQTAKGMLERSFDALGFDAKQRRAFCRSATVDQYLADVDPNNAPHGLCYHSRAESGPWLRSMMHSLNVIRQQRKRQQYHREQSFLEDIGRASRLWAESALSIAIPSLRATVQWKKRVEHYVVVSKSSVNKYDQRTIINVPVYWGKMVHQRGLSYVGHKGQNIFILYAKHCKQLDDDQTETYECAGLTYKHFKPKVDKYWVLKWKGHDTDILAANINLASAKKTLKGKVIKDTIKALTI
jgi:hypothetical protein